MRFPLMFRFDHDEMVAELRRQLEAREKELFRIKDLIFKQQFGVQLHDTLPGEAMPPEPEATDPIEDAKQQERNRLTSIARTRPSQLGPAMERFMSRNAMERARSAHPTHTVSPAKAIFEQAKSEVS